MSVASSTSTVQMKESKLKQSSRPSIASSATVSTIQGDRNKRITVPVPRSMEDLHGHAGRFGLSEPHFFHHGKKHIKHDGHVDRIGGEHVVIVTGWEKPQEPTGTSTHNDTFVPHRIEPRRSPGARPAPESVPFEGTATSADYKAHRIEQRRTPDRPAAPKHEPFTGTSTHQTDFQPHKIEARKGYTKPAAPKQEKFDGTRTSDDFKAHRIEPRSRPQSPQRAAAEPFTGSSSYADAYIPHAVKVGKTPERAPASPSTPFEGTTEYLHHYLKHNIPKRDMVHIEPALHQRPNGYRGRRPQSARH